MPKIQPHTPRIVLHLFVPGNGRSGRGVPPETLEVIRSTLQDRFLLKTLLGEVLPYPEESFSERRGQSRSTDFLFEMDTRFNEDRDIHLGITDVDLYVPELNFVFGEASMSGRSAVFSTWRLDDRPTAESRGEKTSDTTAESKVGATVGTTVSTTKDAITDTRLLTIRAATEAVHEIGHLLGLTHCQRPDCVMWFSNTVAETDRKGSRFCIDHQRELALKLKVREANLVRDLN